MKTNNRRAPRALRSYGAVRAVATLVLISAAPAALAANELPSSSPNTADERNKSSFALRQGIHANYQRTALSWQTAPWWQHTFNGNGQLQLVAEVTGAYWYANRGEQRRLWQVGVTPMVRWWPWQDKSFYIEAGVGPNLISKTRFAGYRLGTRIQFGSHLGLGYVIQQRHRLALRVSHYSNANIRSENEGLNLIQFEYAYVF